MTLADLLRRSRVLPVLVIDDAEHAVPLATTLRDAGLQSVEITLRRPSAMEAIRRIVAEVDGLAVGAGTVTTVTQLQEVKRIGATFAVSPGITRTLVTAAKDLAFMHLPGVVTPSEVMLGLELGISTFKFFPAGTLGGVPTLEAYKDVFAQAVFCPTGGIGQGHAAEYLALRNVIAVGSSWLAPPDLVSAKDWPAISARVSFFLELIRTPSISSGNST